MGPWPWLMEYGWMWWVLRPGLAPESLYSVPSPLSLLDYTSGCERSADLKEALVVSRAPVRKGSPVTCGAESSGGTAPTKCTRVNPLSFEFIFLQEILSCFNILNQRFRNKIFKKIIWYLSFVLFFKSNYSKWTKLKLCWASLVLFCNLVFYNFK